MECPLRQKGHGLHGLACKPLSLPTQGHTGTPGHGPRVQVCLPAMGGRGFQPRPVRGRGRYAFAAWYPRNFPFSGISPGLTAGPLPY